MARLCTVIATVTAAVVAAGGHGTALADSSEQSYPIASSVPAGVRSFLQVETSSAVFNVQYHYGRVTPAANGAYGTNIVDPPSAWFVEDQRYGDTDVIAGVLHDDMPMIKTGLKMFDFALHREATNGSFPGSQGLFHGTAMFLAAAGPAMLVLDNWYRLPHLSRTFVKHVNWEISRMDRAARYMVDSWWSKPGHIDDGGKEERFFEAAVALASTADLAKDSFLLDRARVYAKNGMRMTEPNGVWTENGVDGRCCHDSSYQAMGLVYGTRYLELIAGTPLGHHLYADVAKGEAWEISRVRANGTVNTTGNSRTSGCAERSQLTGKCKTIDLEAVFSALMRWGVLSDNQRFRARAEKVWALNLAEQGKH